MDGIELVEEESTDYFGDHVLEDFGYFPETFLVPCRDYIRKGSTINTNLNKAVIKYV